MCVLAYTEECTCPNCHAMNTDYCPLTIKPEIIESINIKEPNND